MKDNTNQNKRLLSLDILRGITIAGMILVNNPGSWGDIYAPLRHAEWNGLTPTDLVFPFFMFIMGVSTYFSLRKYSFTLSWPAVAKILRRTVVIFAIGLAIAWFGLFLRGILNDKTFLDAVANFDHIRILGVMPRLALSYGFGAAIALIVPHKALPWLVGAILAAYSILLITGNGFDFSDENVISVVDHKVLGPDHMYSSTVNGVRLHFDPEGLLSTLPSVAHMLIGFICGGMILALKDNRQRVLHLFIVGTIMTFAGFLIDYGIPVNKKVWSPTFVLTTCGMASSLLALLMWIIDIRGYRRWTAFFEAFGVNPLAMYTVAALLSIIIGSVEVPYADGTTSIKSYIYQSIMMPVCGGNATLASLLFAINFVLLNWCIAYTLYKKRIYIKI